MTGASLHRATPKFRSIGVVALALLFLLAARFVSLEAGPYLLHFDPIVYGRFWPHRELFIVHVSSGSLALLLGPVQLLARGRWTAATHRRAGKLYLLATAVCAATACYFAVFDPLAWSFAVAFLVLALAWMGTVVMAYVAIRNGRTAAHREWVIRSYVLGFTVVTFRLMFELPALSEAGRELELTIGWLCWIVPLLATEMLFALGRLRSARSLSAAATPQ